MYWMRRQKKALKPKLLALVLTIHENWYGAPKRARSGERTPLPGQHPFSNGQRCVRPPICGVPNLSLQ